MKMKVLPNDGWVSIHAPARGATRCHLCLTHKVSLCFNSRPCERGDFAMRLLILFSNLFQFTPLREGRLFRWNMLDEELNVSIHAPARGATSPSVPSISRVSKFQFTPLREGRPQRRGGRGISAIVSIHAPARGATAIFHKNTVLNL